MLIAFGARAVNPYLAHDCVREMFPDSQEESIRNYDKALTAGVLKIASKMGVSTLQAYQSAQLFEAVGLDAQFIERYFTNTLSVLGGKDLSSVEADYRHYHESAFISPGHAVLENIGRHKWLNGQGKEEHLYTPKVIDLLQQAVRTNDRSKFDEYSAAVERESRNIRSMLEFRYDLCKPVPVEEVEPASEIVRRFRTAAMSYGSISQEAHECMARAMNHLGGMSNSGEGGELPASKVTESVARTRCATPGVSMISPPPHHDIYSIEDLAELIYDLQCANEDAKITVKLVSSLGVGTIASRVAKAGAGGILISGGEGGTGAASMTSIHHAGLPWEIGLAETHQVLCRNRLRQTVTLEAD